ncbi:hypothetical protein [Cupriavidus taiwanensis]|nr:hypothetical protein [Cupriavidus taiwanensis]SPA17230.1 exported hypothetical protein [Cupriavidus taiwanensis]
MPLLSSVCLVFALVLFMLAAARERLGPVAPVPAGLALVVLALLLDRLWP